MIQVVSHRDAPDFLALAVAVAGRAGGRAQPDLGALLCACGRRRREQLRFLRHGRESGSGARVCNAYASPEGLGHGSSGRRWVGPGR